MAVYKNKSSQKVACFAYDPTDGSAVTGDASNITAQISLDGAATAATNDTNPTELDATDAPGIYLFDLNQAETNADLIVIAPVSGTADVLIEPLIIYTEPESVAQTGDSYARLGAPAGASVSADIAAVDTAIGGLNDVSQADITGGAYSLDTDANGRIRIVDGTGTGEIDTSSGKVAATIAAGDIATDAITADALASSAVSEIQSGLSTLDAAGVRTAVGLASANLDIQLSAIDTVVDTIAVDTGTTLPAKLLKYVQLIVRKDAAIATDNSTELTEINADGGSGGGSYANTTDSQEALRDRGDAAWITATGFSTHTAADVWGVATRVLTAGTNIVLAKGAGVTGFNDPTAAAIADAVFDEATADHTTAGSFGKAIADVLADTNELQTDDVPGLIAALNDVSQADITGGAYPLDTDTNGRIRIVDGTGAGEIDTASGAIVQVNQLGTQAKADVNAELVDVMATDTHAQPGQATPPATATYQQMLAYVYKATRNKHTQTSDTFSLYNDDGVTVDQKATVSDDGTTFTRSELTTGP